MKQKVAQCIGEQYAVFELVNLKLCELFLRIYQVYVT